jgi:hypothetical protein
MTAQKKPQTKTPPAPQKHQNPTPPSGKVLSLSNSAVSLSVGEFSTSSRDKWVSTASTGLNLAELIPSQVDVAADDTSIIERTRFQTADVHSTRNILAAWWHRCLPLGHTIPESSRLEDNPRSATTAHNSPLPHDALVTFLTPMDECAVDEDAPLTESAFTFDNNPDENASVSIDSVRSDSPAVDSYEISHDDS